MEVEFGYCTEEESIFQSFSQEIEKIVPRITRTFSMKKDQKNVRIGFEDVVRKVSMPSQRHIYILSLTPELAITFSLLQFTERSRTFEFMIKFKIEVENNQESSSIYSISQSAPLALIEEKEKRKFIKVRILDTY